MWGSNNHLSGSVLRNVNGGGTFLCSNSTFDWCHTTSSERPSLSSNSSPIIVNPLSNQNGLTNDPYTEQTYDGVDRLNLTQATVTITACHFTNMKYTAFSSAEYAGGSALFFTYPAKAISLISCTFSKCSVTSSASVYGGSVYLYGMNPTTCTVEACSFNDWYPSNDGNTFQFGGGFGAYSISGSIVITNSNFTLSGETENSMSNGGFVASYASTYANQSATIENCRFVGDARTTGNVLYFRTNQNRKAYLTVTDSQVSNTNSQVAIEYGVFNTSSGFTRTDFSNTSFMYTGPSFKLHPHLIVDCKLDQCSLFAWNGPIMFLFSGTSFTGEPVTSRSLIHLYEISHVVIHKCDFTDFSPVPYERLIYSRNLPSLVVDTCSFTRCSGGKTIVDVTDTYSFFYFCTFTNVSGTDANVMTSNRNFANFFEFCRFDLETSELVDIVVSSADLDCLNDTAVIGCTSNRQMTFGTSWFSPQELTTVTIISGEVSKNEMRVGAWPTEPEEDSGQQIPTFSSLSDALTALPNPPKDTVITFSDGSFTETGVLEVSQLVEIVGAGSNVSDIHSTQLTANLLVSKSAGQLTLRSIRLAPFSTSSALASTEDGGSLSLLNVVVEDLSAITACLFQFAAGSSEIRHSFFKNIESAESLVCVSGTSSLAITNTLFLSITRTSPEPTPVESTQCASCIEGKTSGIVKLLYSRFGACTSNGRAGAIDLEKSDENSAVEMGSCYFDQNSAGEDVANASRGDDVVLMQFDDSNTRLDLPTIYSFPSPQSFLIDSQHAIVPPPSLLLVSSAGVDDPLTWSYSYGRISTSLFLKHTLQHHSTKRTLLIYLTHIPQGAISISKAPLTISTCTFSDNSPSNLEWPSLRRNIKCTHGTVKMNTMNGGDGQSSHHLWIWTDECTVKMDNETQHSTLFVPTLIANESTSTLDKKLTEYSVKIVGTMMIPCGLKLEVFENNAHSTSNEVQPLFFDISSLQPSKWTETELSFILPQSSLPDLSKKSELRCRLVYADNQTTDSFSLTHSSKGNKTQAGVVTSIVVPIVVVIIVAVLLIIVIAVLCRRRKTKERAVEKDNQELDVADAGDVLKDGDAQDNTIKPIIETIHSTLDFTTRSKRVSSSSNIDILAGCHTHSLPSIMNTSRGLF
ncbi:hypothetical protein BLNAU_9409 [Blattamonas nauphoetae]|uniref:Uncharacterized protein n=1 Tax=Blattamonas nauphoetae TaxID=2049346 RepID=A0ABQ9XVQ2_9EUKA|nr:hypothetical protein BLNAU_9409 [Blattamonas nauphoetae]